MTFSLALPADHRKQPKPAGVIETKHVMDGPDHWTTINVIRWRDGNGWRERVVNTERNSR